MNINKDGTLSIWARKDIEVLEEFGWNVEDMATAIRELREEIEKKDKELYQLNEDILRQTI